MRAVMFEANRALWGGRSVGRFGLGPPSMLRPWGERNLVKKALSWYCDPENQRPNGLPLQISEVKLGTGPDYLFLHGGLLIAL